MATKKREAARRRAALALCDSSKQSSLPASAITEQQRQRSKENKRRALQLRQQSEENERSALQLRNVQASQLVVPSKFTIFSHSAPIGQALALTEHQKRRMEMEHNRCLALERRKKEGSKEW